MVKDFSKKCAGFSCVKVGKIIVPNEKTIFLNRSFFQSGKLFFPIFPSVTLQNSNEIPNHSSLLGMRKDRKS